MKTPHLSGLTNRLTAEQRKEAKRKYDRDRQRNLRRLKGATTARPKVVEPPDSGMVAAIFSKVEVDPKGSAVVALRAWELAQAQRTRGNCSECGHSWRPRNPSRCANRCPACGVRGVVTWTEVTPESVGLDGNRAGLGNGEGGGDL